MGTENFTSRSLYIPRASLPISFSLKWNFGLSILILIFNFFFWGGGCNVERWFQLCLIITFLGNISVSTISTVTGVEGHNVTLICNVSSIYPPVISVTWKFNDTAIDTLLGGKYQGGSISAPSLFVTNLSATDQGNYACSATNVFSTRQAYLYLTLAGEYRYW